VCKLRRGYDGNSICCAVKDEPTQIISNGFLNTTPQMGTKGVAAGVSEEETRGRVVDVLFFFVFFFVCGPAIDLKHIHQSHSKCIHPHTHTASMSMTVHVLVVTQIVATSCVKFADFQVIKNSHLTTSKKIEKSKAQLEAYL